MACALDSAVSQNLKATPLKQCHPVSSAIVINIIIINIIIIVAINIIVVIAINIIIIVAIDIVIIVTINIVSVCSQE